MLLSNSSDKQEEQSRKNTQKLKERGRGRRLMGCGEVGRAQVLEQKALGS